MKKLAAIVIIAALGLGACAEGKTFGDCKPNDKRKECRASSKIPSESPTRTVKPTRKATKTAEPSPTKTEPAFKPNTYTILIRGQNNFYEWTGPGVKGYRQADQGGPRVFVGDIIIFKNMDERNLEHSWSSGYPTDKDFGKVFDSGLIESGKQYKWSVANKPGCYYYSDENVQYISGGPLQIVERGDLNPKPCT